MQKLTKTDANLEAENADAAILGKAQKKAAARANRDSEEAARKRQEELAAAKRATDRSIWFRVCLYGQIAIQATDVAPRIGRGINHSLFL